MDRVKRIAAASIAVGCLVLGIKFLAYRLTGSIALYSDALESIVNVATAVAALFAVQLSSKPADANHPFGHSKVEYFSAIVEGVLIVVAALVILRQAWFGLFDAKALNAPALGLAINACAGVINAVWAWVLVTYGRRDRSPALEADGRHLYTDVLTSAGVIVGLVAAQVSGLHILDPLLAGLVALNILWAGWQLMKHSVAGLMDEAAAPDEIARIQQIIATQAGGAIQAHDLRTRHAGRITFVQFHLVVDGEMSVAEAHDICDRLEDAINAGIEDARITIHVEPDHKAKRSAIVVY